MNTSSKFAVATHILTTLAANKMLFGENSGMNSELLAKSVNTNPVVIRRLLGVLKERGFVSTKLGPNGGAYLIKDAKEISLAHIYSAVEQGNLYHLHYTCPNKICPVGANISDILSTILQNAEQAFKMILAKKTLDDIIKFVIGRAEGLTGKTKDELIIEYNKSLELIMTESGIEK